MNSRSSVNETNLVNFSADLTSLNPLDSKEPLLSFPFDHIYACHSDSSDRTLQLDKEVEISTHCVVAQDKHLTDKLASLENQNKKLKDLLIYHLDLIQQQNDLITKKEKIFQALKQENDVLKSKVTRVDRRVPIPGRSGVNPASLIQAQATSAPISTAKTDVPSVSSVLFNSLEPDIKSSSPFVTRNESGSKTVLLTQEPFEVPGAPIDPDQTGYFPPDAVAALIDTGPLTAEPFTMIEHKRTIKKETKMPEKPSEPLYTVTTNSGNPVIQRNARNRKKSSNIGSLSRMPKTQTKTVPPEASKIYDEDKMFSVNKKTKMVNTYGKSRLGTSKYEFTGSLSDRLKLIDTTPTGEDPYQIGEAEMREQSPIPKLMLQKNNQGKIKICSDSVGGVTSTTTSTTATRRIYDTMNETAPLPRINRYGGSRGKKEPRRDILDDVDLDIVKTESEIDWRLFTTKPVKETSVCDFSYGETTANLATDILPIDISKITFSPDFFETGPVNAETSIAEIAPIIEKNGAEKIKKRGARTTSLAGPGELQEGNEVKRGTESKRGRKRASSTASNKRNSSNAPPKQKVAKTKAAAAGIRAKKDPLPGMTTKEPYPTNMGDPDLSWYLGLDPDIKKEDVDQMSEIKASNVEVPRWREKVFTSLYSLEGTENLDDKVFEKRHQKLEAEERRQLRWHMRRVREQRHVERLRQRQKDPWAPTANTNQPKEDYTVWPQPIRDLKFIDITDTLPVTAFGEQVAAVPETYFVLPWVRTSKAQKRSKRSKTLH